MLTHAISSTSAATAESQSATFGGQLGGDRSSDPFARSGDDRDLAFEIQIHVNPISSIALHVACSPGARGRGDGTASGMYLLSIERPISARRTRSRAVSRASERRCPPLG